MTTMLDCMLEFPPEERGHGHRSRLLVLWRCPDQAAIDLGNRTRLTMPTSWRSRPEAAGEEVQTVTGTTVPRADPPYVQLVFSRDVFAGRAAGARRESCAAFGVRTGGLGSVELARVMDEQGTCRPAMSWSRP